MSNLVYLFFNYTFEYPEKVVSKMVDDMVKEETHVNVGIMVAKSMYAPMLDYAKAKMM